MKRNLTVGSWSSLLIGCIFALASQTANAQWTLMNLNEGVATNLATCDSSLFAIAYGYVFRTTDDGVTWTDCGVSNGGDPAQVLEVNGDIFVASVHGGLLRTRDTGKTWAQCDTTKRRDGDPIFAIGDTLLLNAGGAGTFRSTDEGNSWTQLMKFYNENTARAFTQSGSFIYVGLLIGGVFRSSDAGLTWEDKHLSIHDTNVNCIASHGSLVIVGTYGGGIYRSTDYGDSWQQSNNGLTEFDVRALIFVGDTIFAGCNHAGGVLYSLDSGKSWKDGNAGLPDRAVFTFAVLHNYLFVGGGGSGVWRHPLSGFASVKSETSFAMKNLENSPNPFTQTTTIRFTLTDAAFASIKVYDITGREVAIAASKEFPAGENEVTFDGKELPAGVYYYRIETGSGMAVGRAFVKASE